MSTEPSGAPYQPDQTNMQGEHSLAEIIRGVGVMISPSLLLVLFAALSTVGMLSGWVFRRKVGPARLLRPLAIVGAVLPWVYAFVIRPWHLRWGATDEEINKALPGDELVPEPGIESTRAITVNAPVEEVWPWLAQIGQDQGGLYSYEWLENLAGCQMRNADRIHPEWQHRETGETVFLHPAYGPKVASFEPGRAIVLEGGWTFAVEPIDKENARVFLRSRTPWGLGALSYLLAIELPHFIMERRMLKGIKERAEQAKA